MVFSNLVNLIISIFDIFQQTEKARRFIIRPTLVEHEAICLETTDGSPECCKSIWSLVGELFTHLKTGNPGDSEVHKKNNALDCLWLLNQLRLVTAGIDKKQDLACNIFKTVRTIYTLKQYQNESFEEYYQMFQSLLNTSQMLGANVSSHQGMLPMGHSCTKQNNESKKEVQNKYKSMVFLMSVDHR